MRISICTLIFTLTIYFNPVQSTYPQSSSAQQNQQLRLTLPPDGIEYHNGQAHGMRISEVVYPFRQKLRNSPPRRNQPPPDGVEYRNGHPHGMRILGVLYPFKKSDNKTGWPSFVSNGIEYRNRQPYEMHISEVIPPFQQSADQDVVVLRQHANQQQQQMNLVDIKNGDILFHEGNIIGAVHAHKILQVHSINPDGSLNLLTSLIVEPVSGDVLYRDGHLFAIYQNGFREYSL